MPFSSPLRMDNDDGSGLNKKRKKNVLISSSIRIAFEMLLLGLHPTPTQHKLCTSSGAFVVCTSEGRWWRSWRSLSNVVSALLLNGIALLESGRGCWTPASAAAHLSHPKASGTTFFSIWIVFSPLFAAARDVWESGAAFVHAENEIIRFVSWIDVVVVGWCWCDGEG